MSRYLSEWRHVQRGATWKTSLHMCDGRTPTPEELPSCYEGSDWSGCTLQQFMDCPYNLANNRQVRRKKLSIWCRSPIQPHRQLWYKAIKAVHYKLQKMGCVAGLSHWLLRLQSSELKPVQSFKRALRRGKVPTNPQPFNFAFLLAICAGARFYLQTLISVLMLRFITAT